MSDKIKLVCIPEIFIDAHNDVNICMTQKVMPPLRGKPYGGAWSVYDNESVDFLNSISVEKGNRSAFVSGVAQEKPNETRASHRYFLNCFSIYLLQNLT